MLAADTQLLVHGDHWRHLQASTLDGSPFAMADLAGKPAILYFWATWCPMCQIQRTVLSTLSEEWGDRVRIAALTVDEDLPAVRRYLGSHASLSQELRAPPELLELFGVQGLPTLVLIDGGGQVQRVAVGLTDAAELRRLVAPLLP